MDSKRCSGCRRDRPIEKFEGFKSCDECRARRLKVKHRRNPPSAPLIVRSRKFCTSCKRWRLIVDFGVREWTDSSEETPKFFNHNCRACARIEKRVRTARKTGRPVGGPKPTRIPHDKFLKIRRKRQYEKYRNDPEWAELTNERKRIWAEGKRREQGIPRRDSLIEKRSSEPAHLDPRLPIEPFQEWIRDRAMFWAGKEGSNPNPRYPNSIPGLSTLARKCGIGDKTLQRYAYGRDSGRIVTEVSLGIVDKCLTNEGSAFLWDLYPELLEEDSLDEETMLSV